MRRVTIGGWQYCLMILISFACLFGITIWWFDVLESKMKTRTLTQIASTPLSKTLPPIQHPYYFQECYTYEGTRARFICTTSHQFRKYSYENVLKCASNLWDILRDENHSNPLKRASASPNSASAMNAISKRPPVYLAFVGDSHIRNIFEAFMRRMENPRVKYRNSRMKENEWRDSNYLKVNWTKMEYGEYHELLHLDVSLRITFHWDPSFRLLPGNLSCWMSGNTSKPDYLVFGSALHFMKSSASIYVNEGIEASSRYFFKNLKALSPQLAEFSRISQVVFKLQDHLQDPPKDGFWTNQIIDYYNKLAYDLLPTKKSSSLLIWNSTLPLSDLAVEFCRKNPGVLYSRQWKCFDLKHLGHVFIDQYLDMYLNSICSGLKYKGS